MKKSTIIISTFIIILIWGLFILFANQSEVCASGTTKRTRQINVVYDDSGSMAYDNGKYVSRWSEAKYALEVFAAMMSDSDSMTIFPMSSFSYSDDKKSSTWKKTYSLTGKQDSDTRIQTINEMNGSKGIYMNTPIETVTYAGDNLANSKADEKWLVILTDGEFDNGKGEKIDSDKSRELILKYAKKNSGISVAYIPIGTSAISIESSEDNYFTVSKKYNILDQVKNVAKTVYNYQSISLTDSGSVYSVSSDIPVSKYIIFAQGNNVSVKNLNYEAKEITGNHSVADVQVAKNTKYKPSTKTRSADKMIVASGLKGQVITYDAENENKPFAAGKYSFDCNVDNVEVFFEPGVSIEAYITDTNGEEINLNDSKVTEIDAGKKILHVKIINPLTGEEIDPKSTEQLKGVQLTMGLTDQKDNLQIYNDGDTVDVPEGEISIYAKARFKGNIEKKSSEKSLKVNPAKLSVVFSKKEGYQFDPLNLSGTEDIIFEIKALDGTVFGKEDYKNAEIKISDASGLEWTTDYLGKGKYRLIPEMGKKKEIGDIDTAVQDLSVNVSVKSGKITRSGKGSTKIAAVIDKNAFLDIKLNMPEPGYQDMKKRTYMFDAKELGYKEKAPYILVDVKIKNKDGSSRKLTEEEWKQGIKGFTFDASQIDANILYKIIRIICHQKLSFEVKPGKEISTYRLYLSGGSKTGVLPGKSKLTVNLKIKLKNNIVEEGSGKSEVTVKPVGIIAYLGRFMLVLLILALILLFIIMELQKKRIPRDLEPNTAAYLERAGVPITPPGGPQFSRKKIKYVIFPPLRPEEKKITMKYPQYLTPITFICVAVGNDRFIIKNMDKKFFGVRNRVTFDGRSYDEAIAVKGGMQFSKNSNITIEVSLGPVRGETKLTFTKPQTMGRRNIKRKKKKR